MCTGMNADASSHLHTVCPHCGTTNRLAAGALTGAPDCGRCHQPLFTGTPVALDEAGFRKTIEKSDLPVLVDFWAPWCGPCRAMAPQYEAAARELEPQVRLVKVDTEAAPALAARYNIRSIPTLALFAGGREVARQPGAMGVADIVRWARAHLPR